MRCVLGFVFGFVQGGEGASWCARGCATLAAEVGYLVLRPLRQLEGGLLGGKRALGGRSIGQCIGRRGRQALGWLMRCPGAKVWQLVARPLWQLQGAVLGVLREGEGSRVVR